MHRPLISHRAIARTVRFQGHPTMSACWIWTGRLKAGTPEISATGLSARQDVYERILGQRPCGILKPACGQRLCVNPHHMRGTE